MTTRKGFRPVAEVTADEHARVAVGIAGVHENDRHAVSINDEGAILLVPVASIPKRELLVWEDDELKASLFRGLADAAEGKVRSLDRVIADDDKDVEACGQGAKGAAAPGGGGAAASRLALA